VTLTISKAESAYKAAVRKAEKKMAKRFKLFLVGMGLSLLLSPSSLLFISNELGALWIAFMISGFTLWFAGGIFVIVMDRFTIKWDKGLLAAAETVRASQIAFVTSQGFHLPAGEFKRLAFQPVADPQEQVIYGAATLQESRSRKPVRVVLESHHGRYALRNEKGRLSKLSS
jgi:hypothetical protein